ncbi:hypothetical protein HHI36_001301 [Cryptolaemus montrouzieri]|uniref:MADF domain-containing protein n=1 Tax=Cryptolaemus montrouzieri TaxID=559131 RepID=A0ABD2P7V6_9CUCU
MVWPNEETLSLIEMYRVHPILWDSTNQQYKNKNLRHDNLLELAVSFGVDKQEIERNIKNLHFMREKKKEPDSRKTGSGAEEHYESKWSAFHELMFLVDKNKPRKTKDNIEVRLHFV